MRPGPYLKILLIILILLLGASLYAVDKAFYYRDLYYGNPKVKIERQSSIIYGKFDPDRSSAYTCVTQKVVADVGMICSSPDSSTVINCTVGGNPSEYFC